MKEATNYAGLIYYEEKGNENLVTFTSAKKLNALLEVIHYHSSLVIIIIIIQFIKKEYPQAERGPYVYFRIASPGDYVELNLNAPQKKSYKGWTIEPHTEPCRVCYTVYCTAL